jgi:ribonuclease HI/pterin-4a-carbinolamine dehydratase
MWLEKDNQLYRKFKFASYREAVDFMNRTALIAEQLNHHPKLQNTFSTVELWLTTHDASDAITDKDREFASQIDELFDSPTVVSAKPEKHIKLYADGGSRGNPGPSASGYVLMDMNDTIIFKSGVYLGITTNNQAEYQALKFGLIEAEKLGAREVDVYLDSLLVINQMKGIFKVKNRDLWPIYEAIKELVTHFKHVRFTHVPRELNKLADAEVNEVLDAQLGK